MRGLKIFALSVCLAVFMGSALNAGGFTVLNSSKDAGIKLTVVGEKAMLSLPTSIMEDPVVTNLKNKDLHEGTYLGNVGPVVKNKPKMDAGNVSNIYLEFFFINKPGITLKLPVINGGVIAATNSTYRVFDMVVELDDSQPEKTLTISLFGIGGADPRVIKYKLKNGIWKQNAQGTLNVVSNPVLVKI